MSNYINDGRIPFQWSYDPVPCEECGALVERKGKAKPRFCSDKCRRAEEYERRTQRNAERRAALIAKNTEENPEKECADCGTPAGRHKNGLPKDYCSKACRDHVSRKKRQASGPHCKEAGCDRPSHARGWCGSHYSRWWDSENPERKDMIRKRRDERIASASACEDIDRRVVFERDDWTCNICGGPIPQDAVYPDPLSAQVDHVVPLSQGGDHSYENVAASHMRCNLTKRDGRAVDRHELLASLGLPVV